MPNHTAPVIEAVGLRKTFGPRVALADFQLTVAPGELFALVGPDGAGKTTTIRLLTGIMDPDAGDLRVLGWNPLREAENLKEQIGYMPQRFGLYDDLTVRENLAFYADIYRVPKKERQQRIPELLSFADLARFQYRLAAHLSGGMRQKLGLICTLVHHPRLIFLDEPTFGVDPVSRREFWRILNRLLREGLTIFLSTSYMDEAERASRVGLLYEGRLLQVGSPVALKAGYQGELLEARNGPLYELQELLARQPLVAQTLLMGDRLRLTVAESRTALIEIKNFLEQQGLTTVRLQPASPTLEDVFVQVIRQQLSSGTVHAGKSA